MYSLMILSVVLHCIVWIEINTLSAVIVFAAWMPERRDYRGEHALALANGTAAAEEADDEDNSADADDHPRVIAQLWCGFLVLDQVGEVLLGNLRPDTDGQQRAANDLHQHTHLASSSCIITPTGVDAWEV